MAEDQFFYPPFLDFETSTVNLGFDFNTEPENQSSDYGEPNPFFYGGEEDDEQIDFVTNIFESRGNHATEDQNWEFDSSWSDTEFGSGSGLRVVEMDSDSSSEEFEVNLGFMNNGDDDTTTHNNNDDDDDGFGVADNNYRIENERSQYAREEVSGREDINSIIDQIDELSDLLAMHNLLRNSEFEISELNTPEDRIFTLEHDAVWGRLLENVNSLKGSPPASKSIIENLPSIVLTKEELGANHSLASCAVCIGEFAVGKKITKLPCSHFYHGDCILPWLEIRNTCPVCRYELPTDDANYEKRKSERGGSGFAAAYDELDVDLELRYNLEVLL